MINGEDTAFAMPGTPSQEPAYGLTKREYFAAMAMQGILANETVRDILSGNNGMQVPDLVAEYSLQYADYLIAELNKQ